MSNVLPNQIGSHQKNDNKSKNKISVLGVILTIILTIVVILLGERIMFDLNRSLNPVVQTSVSENQLRKYYQPPLLKADKSSLSTIKIYYAEEKTADYHLYKVLIHAAFVLPIFLLMFLLYYWLNLEKRKESWRVVIWAYMVGVIWLLLHLIGEMGGYIIDTYKNMAIYIILIFLIIVLTALAIFMQKKKINN